MHTMMIQKLGIQNSQIMIQKISKNSSHIVLYK